ncbi:glycosyltransferase family 2 protein [Leptolyngbya sp. CCNP1308]|uniref:glycosyltransferase n=1 Tax=Leptolyngbya sp. CCNP1308 TaxID=3110255 RepID=UPI002B21DFBD|nr:glycosyltransferase family 2 protein [Leptolyngbya sp. CCNP1308]MEA5451160.1 glycosyltransferase family 2 protein [Leptolyngbya sp. CCNP1308]
MDLDTILLGLNGLLGVALVAIAAFYLKLTQSLASAPRLQPAATPLTPAPSVDVVIPAYNEASNIRACVEAVLTTEMLGSQQFEVWIADDQSTDATGAIAAELAAQHPNVHHLAVPPRPDGETWRGKNWACAHAAEFAQGDYLLFIDADVRLSPGTIPAALAEAQTHRVDLLSCAPKIECSCFAEWLVQPIMMSAIAIAYDFNAINESTAVEDAFAAGPFMLFRRAAYDQIGGHAAIHAAIVEDVELARQIRRHGLKLRYVLGIDLLSVRMYSSFATLWEGWTKNYYLGTEENLPLTLLSAFTIAMVFVMPWVGLLASLTVAWLQPELSWPTAALYGLTVLTLGAYGLLRITGYRLVGVPLRYWWLSSVGGVIVVAIALTSIVKTKTGWGWTWRGRSLKAS